MTSQEAIRDVVRSGAARFSLRVIVAILFAFLGLPAAARAAAAAPAPCEVLASQEFERPALGHPDVTLVPFSLDNPLGGPFSLEIEAESEQSKLCRAFPWLFFCRHDLDEVVVAFVTLNGKRVGDPVFRSGKTVRHPVALRKKGNLLAVTVVSRKSALRMRILDGDRRSPLLTLTRPTAGTILNSSSPIQIQGSIDDPSGRVLVNGTPVSTASGTFSTQVALREGSNTVAVEAIDACFNTASVGVTVHVDSTPPALSAAANEVCSGVTDVTGKVTDAGPVKLALLTPGGPRAVAVNADGTFSERVVLEDENAASLVLEARDQADNVGRQELALRPFSCPAPEAACLRSRCDPATRTCTQTNAPDETSCELAGDRCVLTATCREGSCVPRDVVTCSSATAECSAGPSTCNPETGRCESQPAPDGTACAGDGGDACRVNICRAGMCGVPRDCRDMDPCTEDRCSPRDGCVNIRNDAAEQCEAPEPARDVTIKEYRLQEGDLRAGKAATLRVQLDAAADHPDYSFECLLFPNADSEEGVEVPALHLLGQNFPLLPAGSNPLDFNVKIPGDAAAGEYELACHEYPDLDGSRFVQPETAGTLYVIGEADPGARPVLALGEPLVEPASFVLEKPNFVRPLEQPVDTVIASLVLQAQDAPAQHVGITADLLTPDGPLALRIRNAATGEYEARFIEEALAADEPTDVVLDLALSESDGEALISTLPPQTPVPATVRVSLNRDGGVVEAVCDASSESSRCPHVREFAVVLFVPLPQDADATPIGVPSPSPVTMLAATSRAAPRAITGRPPSNAGVLVEKVYRKFYGSKLIGAGVDFIGRAQYSRSGLFGRLEGAIPTQFFGRRSSFASAKLLATVPQGADADFFYEVKLAGLTLMDEKRIGTSLDFPLGFASVTVHTPRLESTILIGPVPVTLFLGGTGSFKVTGSIVALVGPVTSSLTYNLVPEGALSAVGGASVGKSGWGFAVGVEVAVDLIRAMLLGSSGGRFDVIVNESGLPSKLRGSLVHDLSYEHTTLSGKVQAFAVYPAVKFCKVKIARFLKIKLPCGFEKHRTDKTLVEFQGQKFGPQILSSLREEGREIDICDPASGTCTDPGPGDAICGDRRCDAQEDCGSCAMDCGVCEGPTLFQDAGGGEISLGSGPDEQAEERIFVFDVPEGNLIGGPMGVFPLGREGYNDANLAIQVTGFTEVRRFALTKTPDKVFIDGAIRRPSRNRGGAVLRFNLQFVKSQPPRCGNAWCETDRESLDTCPADCVE